MARTEPGHAIVIEFLGLPGSGKSTVCRQLQALLLVQGIHAANTQDFVRWSASQSRLGKLAHALRAPARTARHLFSALRFWWSLDRRSAATLRRALLAAPIAASLARYVQGTDADVILLDQADMQGVWSIGALASSFDGMALDGLLTTAAAWVPRTYVHTDADVTFAANNIAERPDGGSRFDRLQSLHVESALQQALPLMTAIADWLRVHHDRVLTLPAQADVDRKARDVADFVHRLLSQPVPRAEPPVIADG